MSELSPLLSARSPPSRRRQSVHSNKSSLHSIRTLWERGHKTEDEIAKMSPHIAEYYRDQNELLEDFRVAASNHSMISSEDRQFLDTLNKTHTFTSNAQSDRIQQEREEFVRRAVLASNLANTFLLIAQIFAFMRSGSLAVLACFLDAILDFVSGLLIFATWYLRQKRDKHRYPVGRERLEPLGVMGMACLMTAATLLTLEESVSSLVDGSNSSRFAGLSFPVVSVMVTALVTKSALWAYCGRSNDVSVQALREDHRNDVLSNATSLIAVSLASNLWWWLDPLGGIIISCLIIRNWVAHTLEHCDQLLGKCASRGTINTITFLACNHPGLECVDTVRCYHLGAGCFAEVDVVLPRELPLYVAHDRGESLQVGIETAVDGVERCFVHLDTETSHNPSIEHKEL